MIVFFSGCNIIFYNFETKEQKFIQRKTSQRRITYLSIGHTKSQKYNETLLNDKSKLFSSLYNTSNNNYYEVHDLKDILICIGEYSEKEELFYVSVIRPFVSNSQYTIKSTDKKWMISFTTILNNSPYCVCLSKKVDSAKKNNIPSSRISFMKYNIENFISQETISEDLIYCCYNPKNTIELVLCGKGYLRLWNVFINEGSLKEHQQRFLRGKQEKEKTFIKAQFFDKKPFLLIVGTWENVFYIIDSFQVIHELNVCYSIENIFDLNVQNFYNHEDFDDISKIPEKIIEGLCFIGDVIQDTSEKICDVLDDSFDRVIEHDFDD